MCMLRIDKLVKNYGRCRALNGLSMEVKRGELFGFIGPNGAGKTTAIKIMTGLLRADSGQVFLDGMDALRDADKLKLKIGYVPDFFGVYDNLKAIEYMEFYASTYGLAGQEVRERCYSLMEQVGLEGRGEVYVDELSRGMQQRLCLARAMIHHPQGAVPEGGDDTDKFPYTLGACGDVQQHRHYQEGPAFAAGKHRGDRFGGQYIESDSGACVR